MRWIQTVLLALALVFSTAVQAAYPSKPVRIVVTGGPGAGGDTLARLLAQRLSEEWSVPVGVDNKSGGGGQVSANEVLRAPADGYTLFISNDAPAIAPLAFKNLSYDYKTAFAPISLLVLIDFKLFVRAGLPVKNVAELVAYAQAHPATLSYASAGMFTSHHLMPELFKARAKIDALHIPYVGAVPAITSIAAGRSDFGFAGFTSLDGFVQAGQIREIATTGTGRNRITPNLPTIAETLPGYSAYSWFAMWTRSEVPAADREKIAASVTRIMKQPDVVDRLKQLGMDAVGGTPQELKAHLDTESAKWSSIPASVFKQ